VIGRHPPAVLPVGLFDRNHVYHDHSLYSLRPWRWRHHIRVSLRLTVYRQSFPSWRQAPWDSRQHFFFQPNTCFHGPYVTSSLTRGWVCTLQLLLALASTVILRSDSRWTRDHILLSQIWDSPTWRTRSRHLSPPGTGFPFRRLLRLAGIRPRLHTGVNSLTESKSELLATCISETSAVLSTCGQQHQLKMSSECTPGTRCNFVVYSS
jgi:hypothetical protein